MELVKPAIGLIFWMVVAFGALLFILGKFAWKPILGSLKEREDSIQDALDTARRTKEEMAALKSGHEKLIAEARLERDQILKQAREVKEGIIAEAKGKAQSEANEIITRAKEEINLQKLAAITEIQNQVANLSVDIAEKILRHELNSDEKQKALMASYLKDVNVN
jgi:F-type H+-transporting ATPase subunit b